MVTREVTWVRFLEGESLEIGIEIPSSLPPSGGQYDGRKVFSASSSEPTGQQKAHKGFRSFNLEVNNLMLLKQLFSLKCELCCLHYGFFFFLTL